MTIALEHIQPEDWAAVNRVVDALRSLVLDTGGRSLGLRVGVKSFSWPGGTALQTFSISHGLGRTPAVVLAVNGSNNTRGMPRTYSYTATTFALDVITSDASNPGAATADTYGWVAIG
jgi:hypothetical protein